MSGELAKTNGAASNLMPAAIERVLIQGDLSGLNSDQRLSYYKAVCESVGLNTLTRPFDYIELNRKLVLYAKRDATDQLRKIHNVSIQIVNRELIGDVYVVTARAKMPSGREDESTGAVAIGGLRGDGLANAYLKAETKAKRRVTLSICGLGLLDETEVETITPARANEAVAVSTDLDTSLEHLGNFLVTFGKYKGLTLSDISIPDIKKYIGDIEAAAKQQGRSSVTGLAADFIDAARAFIAAGSDDDGLGPL